LGAKTCPSFEPKHGGGEGIEDTEQGPSKEDRPAGTEGSNAAEHATSLVSSNKRQKQRKNEEWGF